MLTTNREVTYLFRNIVGAKENALVFCPCLDTLAPTVEGNTELLEAFELLRCKITAISPQHTKLTNRIAAERDSYKYSYGSGQQWEISVDERLELFHPKEKFHYAFAFPPFKDDGSFVFTHDIIRDWKCSHLVSRDFVVPRHILALESMLDACMPAGYFGAVLPRNWMSAYMKFMQWWNTSAALVAKIALPSEAVQRWVHTSEDCLIENEYDTPSLTTLQDACQFISAPKINSIKYYLHIWQKPVKEEISKRHYLSYATYRHSAFVYDLKGLQEKDINKCVKRFRKHDWNKLSVKKFVKICTAGKGIYTFDSSNRPEFLAQPSDTKVIRVSESNKPEIKVVETVEEIKADPMAAHIKLGPPCKVYGYSYQAQATLHDIRISELIPRHYAEGSNAGDEDQYPVKDTFLTKVRSGAFAENREWILKKLAECGLVPYMTSNEYQRMFKQERWLNIQLTPIERTIKIHGEEEEDDEAITKTEEEGEAEPDYWETLYDDVSLKVVYPEVWNLWEQRARKMRLDKTLIDGKLVTYEFQFTDIVTMACKQSILNSNVMGLGKTREALLLALLRGSKRSMFIVPTKLVGVWQEEIETTIANYVRKQRKDWAGNLMSADYQVIEWAKQCELKNLKTFNLMTYEKISRVPRDSKFFVCPVCKFVVCSMKSEVRHMPCPECNKGKAKKAKVMNREAKLYKRKVRLPDGTLEVQDQRINSIKNNTVWMQQSDTQWDKVTREVKQVADSQGHISNVMTEKLRRPHLKWTFSELLRGKFNFVICDEGSMVANPAANRSIALNKINGRHRGIMTGTPIRGYPRSLVNLLNWTFKRYVFADYRSEGGKQTGLRKFEQKYGTYVQREGQAPKLLPKINNPELFQQEIAPLNLRHTRYEPKVIKDIPPKVPTLVNIKVAMDDMHKHYYNLWLEKFAEWWQIKRIEEDKKEAKLTNDLLVKLGYLINASTIPHFMLENLSGEGAMWAKIIGEYKGPLTKKFEVAKKLVAANYEAGDKTIVFCSRIANIKLGYAWAEKAMKPKIPSIWIDGSVDTKIKEGINRSERQIRVDKFRHHDYGALWAGIACLKEGYNIPEANHGVFMDYTWTPDDWQQALGRMLRPSQKKQVDATFLCHKGTAEEYMAALVQLKGRSIGEAIDHEAFDDFNTDMIPDFRQYANAIVDGTEKELKTKMWLQLEELRKESDEE